MFQTCYHSLSRNKKMSHCDKCTPRKAKLIVQSLWRGRGGSDSFDTEVSLFAAGPDLNAWTMSPPRSKESVKWKNKPLEGVSVT